METQAETRLRSPSAEGLADEAARVLEWDRILDLLAGLAHSAVGAEQCRKLFLARDLETATRGLRETAEMVAASEGADPFPAVSFPDLRATLGRATKGAILEARELGDFSVLLGIAEEARRHLSAHQEEAPELSALASPLCLLLELSRLKREIDRCVDSDGNIRDTATPELHRLLHHARGLKQAMRDRLEGILSSERYADALQERFFSERENRYVIPVKAEMRSKIPGIVHDVSASGATVFLEPRELVDLNNSIKVSELEVAREIHRILQELTGLVAGEADALSTAMEVLGALDCIAAKAALSRRVKGRSVGLNDKGRIVLRNARHPLLVLARDHVVANDIVMEESARVLVISGPNTGGKTVTLKIIGLFALMARAGLELPCGPDSEMALFPAVYADIGDAQDLTRDLSSFSAHMTKLVRILAETSAPRARGVEGDPGPGGVLVLLDELATSTDPVEGAALAEALLMRLSDLGLKVVVTTHYNSLKVLAQTTPGLLNASVELDVKTLSPTYRLILGVPGGSSAIEIAGRLGIDEGILEQALTLIRREDRLLDRMMEELREKRRRLDEDTERIEELKAAAERAKREAADTAERLKLSEREERKGTRRRLGEELQSARAEIGSILDEVKRERSASRAREARQRLAEIEQRTLPQAKSRETTAVMPVAALEVGDRVEITSLGARGRLLETPQGKKRVRVRVGEAEMSVPVDGIVGLRSVEGGDESDTAHRAGPARRVGVSTVVDDLDTPGALDVRGKTADEALDLTIAALDHAAVLGAERIRIIHGHGTGRLKAALREYLRGSPYVASFQPAERRDGGDGVTIVELK